MNAQNMIADAQRRTLPQPPPTIVTPDEDRVLARNEVKYADCKPTKTLFAKKIVQACCTTRLCRKRKIWRGITNLYLTLCHLIMYCTHSTHSFVSFRVTLLVV